MSVYWLVAGLVVVFVALDIAVLVYLFRRAAGRAAAMHVPSQRIPPGRPRQGAFDGDDALTWTSAYTEAAFRADDHGLTWTDDLDGYTDLSGASSHGSHDVAAAADSSDSSGTATTESSSGGR